jgi:hypothetical protein
MSPALTVIFVTVPDRAKLNPRVRANCTVPAAAAVTVTVPRCTVTAARLEAATDCGLSR